MDQSAGHISRTSGIPHFSRLPVPRAARDPTPSESSLVVPVRKSNGSNTYKPGSKVPQQKLSESSLHASAPLARQASISYGDEVSPTEPRASSDRHALSSINPQRDESVSTESFGIPLEISASDVPLPARDTKSLRKPRASLSDRTIETLSQIPPSPSPYRRKSGFHNVESPMRPPTRPASAMTRSRPTSRAGTSAPKLPTNDRPASPPKRLVAAVQNGTPSSTKTPSKRAVSSYVPRTTPSRLKQSSPPAMPSNFSARKPLDGSKTYTPRHSRTRPSTKDLFKDSGGIETKGNTKGKAQIPKSIYLDDGDKNTLEKRNTLEDSSRDASRTESVDVAQGKELDIRGPSASSIALRKTIAAAKAARRAAAAGASSVSGVPRSVAESHAITGPQDVDPFTFDLSETGTDNVLRKRINTAKTDGRLNIAALGLSELPKEVVHMYKSGTANTSGVAWYECVDIVRLNAADNEITMLDEEAFPDVIPEAKDEADEEGPNLVFASLETIDLHGNRLATLPPGLRKLDRLTILNLSRNKITNAVLGIVGGLKTLRELRLGENALHGALPSDLCNLTALEILDVHNNSVSSLPEEVEKLSRLRVLNVSDNKLSSIPFSELVALPLIEVDVSKNRLGATLLPSSVLNFPTLRILEAGENALTSFSDRDVELPCLQSINLSNNRLTALPDMKCCRQLSSLIASQNQLTSLPEGLSYLPNLGVIDISGNSVSKLEDYIGSMANLKVLRIDRNPIKERRLLSLNTEDLKLELRSRSAMLEPSASSGSNSPTATKSAGSDCVFEQSDIWPVKAGVLDRSDTKLRSLDRHDLTGVVDVGVKAFILQRNVLQYIPLAIADLATSLTTLDISHNKLGQNNTYLTDCLDLPRLQTFSLTSNSLTTLSPLLEYLKAPNLRTLNVSFNRLTSLPSLRISFPSLTKLLASNNAITNIDVQSVRGLQVLDVSSNDIGYLPPQLALLQGDLKTLVVGGNRFRVPGWGVVEKGTEEILSWLRKRIPVGEEGFEEVDSVD